MILADLSIKTEQSSPTGWPNIYLPSVVVVSRLVNVEAAVCV